MAFSKTISVHPLANMTEFEKTPCISIDEFKELGYKIVILPVSALRVANKATKEAFEFIKMFGSQKDLLDKMQTRQELYKLIKYSDYEAFDKSLKE